MKIDEVIAYFLGLFFLLCIPIGVILAAIYIANGMFLKAVVSFFIAYTGLSMLFNLILFFYP